MSIRLHPSLLAADFVNIESELRRIDTADAVHVDVMDNHFVPALTFGPQMVGRIAQVSPIPLDVHLMIDNPDKHAVTYAEVGAHSVTFHVEAAKNCSTVVANLREAGAAAGVALKPATSIDAIAEVIRHVDMILVMTVEPGFGGQAFMEDMLPKVRAARRLADSSDADIWVQVDGGVGPGTIERAAFAGADVFVAGSSVFRSDDPAVMVEKLRAEAENAARP